MTDPAPTFSMLVERLILAKTAEDVEAARAGVLAKYEEAVKHDEATCPCCEEMEHLLYCSDTMDVAFDKQKLLLDATKEELAALRQKHARLREVATATVKHNGDPRLDKLREVLEGEKGGGQCPED